MAEAIGKTRCVICSKEKATLRCGGCLQEYCSKHLENHRQELNKQFDEIEVNRDLFRQTLTQQIEQPNNHLLIQEIDAWEQKSIKRIQQLAEETRQTVLKSLNQCIDRLENKLNNLTNQLRESRDEDDFNEINLRLFQGELDKLTYELSKPSNISIREDSALLINNISVDMSGDCLTSIPNGEN
jgi:chromosome segregation ATPase